MAMRGDRLYDVIEFVLNEATEDELEVVRSALKRRIEGTTARGPMGIDPARLARQTAASVQKQLGGSLGNIRDMVRRFAIEVIRKEAPELTEEQVGGLLATWMPERRETQEETAGPTEAPLGGEAPQAGEGHAGKGLPPKAAVTMITQFVAYATESMPISEQVKLRDGIGDWQRKYWERFSPRVRDLISLFLNGSLDKEIFWERIFGELGIDPATSTRRE